MHLSLFLLAIGVACGIRVVWALFVPSSAAMATRTRLQQTLLTFLFPPLLLLTTAIAVLYMGTQGQMLGLPVGWIGYSLALGFLGYAGGSLLWATGQAWRSLQQLPVHPQCILNGLTGRVLAHPTPFAAQVGFWRSQLLVSQGLLDTLSSEQLEAVLAHEQAHAHYRDTFWFFWWGWLRQVTGWLPQTEALWQKLLLLRELRADRWAAQRVDPLLLAEALLVVVQVPSADSLVGTEVCAAFGADPALNRLEERIEALLDDAPLPDQSPRSVWLGLLLTLAPFLTVLFHV